MASQANWELDPETRTKLAALQKKEGLGNDKCCDCGAPSPQWASPKFAIFICLQCAGTHRGLGVHISFVRSISMDAFKAAEILRMQMGGNKRWQDYFDTNSGIPFEEATIKERYDCEVGEEYKERLTAKVEGREFDKPAFLAERQKMLARIAEKKNSENSRSGTPAGVGRVGLGGNNSSRTASPAPGSLKKGQTGIDPAQKAQNEAYFARMGEANASRPEGVAPNQGGKYAGFGSAPVERQQSPSNGIPSANEFQTDPVAALTKGLGWFTTAVTKQAKVVNESYIQPTAKNLASTDFAAQARSAATTVGQTVQTSAKGAAVTFNKFVEGQDEAAAKASGAAPGRRRVEPERKDFWDSFGGSNEGATTTKANNIGTAAMKKPTNEKKKEDGWGDDW